MMMEKNSSLKILCLLMASWIVPLSCTVWDKNSQKLAVATNHFGCNLYTKLRRDSSGNVFFSPLSLSMAFGMLYHGAKGLTAKELYGILGYQKAGFTDNRVTVSVAFHTLMLKLVSPKYALKTANRILVDQFMDVRPAYKADVLVWYKAKVEKSNFAAESLEVKNKANEWVKKETKGMIDSLLTDISPDAVMMILNAVYFNGTWVNKFTRTSMKSFFMKGLYPRDVPMMNIKNTVFPYASFPSYSALELPYEGNVSMLVLLPRNRDGLSGLEASLSSDLLATTMSSLRPQTVNVYLPKFRLDWQANLNLPLQDMGMRSVFGPGADLSWISSNIGMRISEVVHKAAVSVDEQGTVAAAASGMSTGRSFTSGGVPFVVDHPFLFAIVEKGTGMVMFLGGVRKL